MLNLPLQRDVVGVDAVDVVIVTSERDVFDAGNGNGRKNWRADVKRRQDGEVRRVQRVHDSLHCKEEG